MKNKDALPDSFFRQDIDAEEAEKFRQWARDNYAPGKEADGLWHPLVREEWAKLEKAQP